MRRSGYTLMELIVTVVIISVLSAAIYGIVLQCKDAAESVDVRAQLSGSARFAAAEITRDLAETDRDTVTTDAGGAIPSFTDPINGETHQILVFASARGDPSDPPEDGLHANNDYVHLDAGYKPSWRSVIVYATYVTPEGLQQLRKYAVYGSAFSQEGIFPVSVTGVTAAAISLQRGDGAGLVIPRNSGVSRANNVTFKEAGTTGADFTLSGSLIKVKLYLRKAELPTKGGTRTLDVTLTDSVSMRNK